MSSSESFFLIMIKQSVAFKGIMGYFYIGFRIRGLGISRGLGIRSYVGASHNVRPSSDPKGYKGVTRGELGPSHFFGAYFKKYRFESDVGFLFVKQHSKH